VKLTDEFLKDLLADYQQYGAGAIRSMRQEAPVKYCILLSNLLPKEIAVDINETKLDEMSVDQINDLIETVQKLIGARTAEVEDGGRENTSLQKVH
jgi:hypothetical protein